MAQIFQNTQLPIQQQVGSVASSAGSDPLFEALVRYITSGPGPSPVTTSEIQSIIDAHTDDNGGRAFLQSIVQPSSDMPIKLWKNSATANGFLSTNLQSLTLFFNATRNMIFQKIEFRGSVKGFFPPQVFTFDENAKFYWDDIADNTAARIEVEYLVHVNILTVRFYDVSNNHIGELLVTDASVRLPPLKLNGEGTFKFLSGPQ